MGLPELCYAPGLIKVPTNETENHFVIGRTLILFWGRTHSLPRRFQDRDGLLHAVVHGQALLRWLGLALDDESFQSR